MNARSVELQGKHFPDTNIQDISVAGLRGTKKNIGEQKRNDPSLKTILFSKTFEKI